MINPFRFMKKGAKSKKKKEDPKKKGKEKDDDKKKKSAVKPLKIDYVPLTPASAGRGPAKRRSNGGACGSAAGQVMRHPRCVFRCQVVRLRVAQLL